MQSIDFIKHEAVFTGAHKFLWGSYWCYADVSGALYIEKHNLLIVSDLHFEKATHFAHKRQFLPPYDTKKTLQKLVNVAKKFNPKYIVSLGDAFHDGCGRSRLSDDNVVILDKLSRKYKVQWVIGNHDLEELEDTNLTALEFLKWDDICFVHEAQKKTLGLEISGHYHPCATLTQRGRDLRRRCFIFDETRMILPAFGSLTGSLNVTNPTIQSFFDRDKTKVILLGDKTAHQMPLSACKRAR